MGGRCQLSCSHTPRAGSLVPLTTRLALVWCPEPVVGSSLLCAAAGEEQASSPDFMIQGMALSPVPGSKE